MSSKKVSLPVQTQVTSNAYLAAWESVHAEVESLPEARKRPYTLDATYAAGTAVASYERCEPMLPTLCALPTFDEEPVRKIPLYARALQYTHAAATSSSRAVTLATLAGKAGPMLERFDACVTYLATFGAFDASTLEAHRGAKRRSYRAMVEAILAYAHALRPVVTAADNKLMVKEGDLDEALAVAQKFTETLASPSSKEGALWIERRQRVATLLWHAYTELRRGVDFVRFRSGDASELVPSLYVVGSAKRASEEKPAEDPTPVDGGENEGAKGGEEKPADDDAPHGPPGSITNPFLG